MKFAPFFYFLVSGAAAFVAASDVSKLQDLEDVTDELLFNVTLPEFTSRRDALDPSTLIWTSDGCTSSPDNPFGFPFVPACNRHDFGYNNYRAQDRFDESVKSKIDDNFKDDLYYQCESVNAEGACKVLANIYHIAVKLFGGDDATPEKRDEDLVKAYDREMAIYNKLVQEAQQNGKLPVLDKK